MVSDQLSLFDPRHICLNTKRLEQVFTVQEPQLDGLRWFDPSLAEKILICIGQVTMGAQNLTKTTMVGQLRTVAQQRQRKVERTGWWSPEYGQRRKRVIIAFFRQDNIWKI